MTHEQDHISSSCAPPPRPSCECVVRASCELRRAWCETESSGRRRRAATPTATRVRAAAGAGGARRSRNTCKVSIHTAVFVDFILAQTPGLPRRSDRRLRRLSCHVSRDARRRPTPYISSSMQQAARSHPTIEASFLTYFIRPVRYFLGISDAERGHAVAPQSQRPHRSRSVRARTVYVDTPRPPLLCRTHSSPPRLPPVRLWHRAE